MPSINSRSNIDHVLNNSDFYSKYSLSRRAPIGCVPLPNWGVGRRSARPIGTAGVAHQLPEDCKMTSWKDLHFWKKRMKWNDEQWTTISENFPGFEFLITFRRWLMMLMAVTSQESPHLVHILFVFSKLPWLGGFLKIKPPIAQWKYDIVVYPLVSIFHTHEHKRTPVQAFLKCISIATGSLNIIHKYNYIWYLIHK